jgi:hypothetical protein
VAALVEHMSIDHSRGHVFVAQEFLDGSNIIAALEQVRGKRMAEGVASDMLDNTGPAHSLLHGPLENGFMHMMAALLTGPGVLPAVLLRKDPLPALVGGSVGVFAVQGVGHLDSPPALGEVPLMDLAHTDKMFL